MVCNFVIFETKKAQELTQEITVEIFAKQ